jgi:hypothetical protein
VSAKIGKIHVPACSPAKAGVQEREALECFWPQPGTLLRSVLGPGLRRGSEMKPLNVFPMVIMLIAIVLLIIWLRPH